MLLGNICRFTSSRMPWLMHWLSHHHLPVRLAAARLIALAATAATPEAVQTLQQQLLGSFPPLEGGAAGGSSSKLEEQEGSMLAAGEGTLDLVDSTWFACCIKHRLAPATALRKLHCLISVRPLMQWLHAINR